MKIRKNNNREVHVPSELGNRTSSSEISNVAYSLYSSISTSGFLFNKYILSEFGKKKYFTFSHFHSKFFQN